jgi:hypothetical protein
MALKMDRLVDATEIGYFLNEVAERGSVVVVSTGGSGVALDSPTNVATVATSPSGQRPLGILLNDFVSVDRTRIPINWLKDQSASGDKCTILTKGWCVTNKVLGTITAGNIAYLAESGNLRGAANTAAITNTANQPFVGRFRSGKSEDGYARVYVDL